MNILDIFEESGKDVWIMSVTYHTRFKTWLYVNVPSQEIHFDEPETEYTYAVKGKFYFIHPFSERMNDNWYKIYRNTYGTRI